MNVSCADCNKPGKLGNDIRTYVITHVGKESDKLLCYPCFQIHERTMQVTHKIRDKNEDT